MQDATELAVLKTHLLSETKETVNLEAWLLQKLDHNLTEGLHQWCYHWEGRIDNVENFEQQVIVRSLFIQSLRRLVSLDSITAAPSATAESSTTTVPSVATEPSASSLYMRLDIDEVELQPKRRLADGISSFMRTIKFMPAYQSCRAANHDLLIAAENAADGKPNGEMKEILSELWAQQAQLFF